MQTASHEPMPRFVAIEGLRAWLVWAVVLSHVDQSLGLETLGAPWAWPFRAGEAAVLVFIVISGFVITGLIVDKQESYGQYILRRAFRIFPAYWIAYVAALFTLPLAIEALAYLPWDSGYADVLHGWTTTMAAHPTGQLLLHFTLFQGVVPDSVWPLTGTAVLGPAWSLTLEWQFYLVAPALVWLLARPGGRGPLIAAAALLALATWNHVFGVFNMPTFLPGMLFMFMIGMASRLGFSAMQRAPLAPALALGALAMGVLFKELLWLGVWLAVYLYLINEDRWRAQRSSFARLADWALRSRWATFLGARSYSVYVVHLPIIQLLTWLIAPRWSFSQTEWFFVLSAVTLPVTFVVSGVLYELVERPLIKLGARLAQPRPRPAPAS